MDDGRKVASTRSMATRKKRLGATRNRKLRSSTASAKDVVVAQLDEIQRSGGDGVLELGRGASLDVSSLDKLYFPKDGFSKGDLMNTVDPRGNFTTGSCPFSRCRPLPRIPT